MLLRYAEFYQSMGIRLPLQVFRNQPGHRQRACLGKMRAVFRANKTTPRILHRPVAAGGRRSSDANQRRVPVASRRRFSWPPRKQQFLGDAPLRVKKSSVHRRDQYRRRPFAADIVDIAVQIILIIPGSVGGFRPFLFVGIMCPNWISTTSPAPQQVRAVSQSPS